MRGSKRFAAGAAIVLAAAAAAAQAAISDNVVKIAVLNDMTGPYSASSGPNAVVAVQMAVEDFGGKVLGAPIEVVSADHQNKPDLGAAIATRWFDRDKVDVIVDVPGSSVALAVQAIARDRNRVFIAGGAGTTELTGKQCSPTGVQYIYDVYALAATAGRAAVEQVGRSFYFLTVDYTFGQALQQAVTHFVESAGGEVLGSVSHPLGTTDFSSYLLQAQASGAKVVALANAAGDTVNSIKNAHEFRLADRGQSLLALLVGDPDIKAVGLDIAQNLLVPTSYFWNRNEETIAWARRFHARTGVMPSFSQAGAYSYTMHYLKAVEAAKTDEARAAVDMMKKLPINDWFAENGYIREDGRMVHDFYLVRVKSPEQSTEEWDFFELVQTVKGEDAVRPLEASECPYLARN